MRTINSYNLFLIIILSSFSLFSQDNYAIQSLTQRIYQHFGFLLSEQLYAFDESQDRINEPDLNEKFSTSITNGQILDSKGQPLNIEKTNFVMDKDGSLFVARGDFPKLICHSYFLKINGVGTAVAMAGTLSVKDGKITAIANNSGHYQPVIEQLILAVQYLNEKDLLASEVQICDHSSSEKMVLTLDYVLAIDAQQILNAYPVGQIDSKQYIENFERTTKEFQEAIKKLKCPDVSDLKDLSSLSANFKMPPQEDYLRLGTIARNDRNWEAIFEQVWGPLPTEVLNAPASSFLIMGQLGMEVFYEKLAGGAFRRIVGCQYTILSTAERNRQFTLWLLPLAQE